MSLFCPLLRPLISSSLMWLDNCCSETGFSAACLHRYQHLRASIAHSISSMTMASQFLPVTLLSRCRVPLLFSCLLWLGPYFSSSYLHFLSSSSIPMNMSSFRSWILTISLQVRWYETELFACYWQCPVFVSLEHIRHAESPKPEFTFHKISRWLTDMKVCKVLCYQQRLVARLESKSHDALQMAAS